MKSNNTDIFEANKKNSFQPEDIEDSNNFFLQETSVTKPSLRDTNRRLNDYDHNLLEEDAYKDISDEVFKLEYKISKLEAELKNIDSQIEAANTINNSSSLSELTERQIILQKKLEELLRQYNQKSVSARISERFTFKKRNKLNKFVNNIHSLIKKKLPKKITSILELKDYLTKLNSINKSVDSLINTSTPIGEDIDKYEQISKYIIKANSIQSKISKSIK